MGHRSAGRLARVTSSDVWDADTAEHYEQASAAMYDPGVLDPAVELLAGLADGGAALELAIGTGRVALPLLARGVPVTGIELSQPMLDVLRRQVDGAALPVTVGDMATTQVDGAFSLVYLVYNSISNLRTQDEQVACFVNAARHLRPGGRFLVELWVPPLRRMPPGQDAVPFEVTDDHLGFDTYDLVSQQSQSHHVWTAADGTVRRGSGRFRYAWPAELDLMARLAGMSLESRWAGFDRSPFTSESQGHVSVWRTPLAT